MEVAARTSKHRKQRLDNGKVGISRRAVYAVPLADLGDKFAVGAVGIGDEPVIHLTHTKPLIHKCLRITVAEFHFFCKEFGAANFDCVRI